MRKEIPQFSNFLELMDNVAPKRLLCNNIVNFPDFWEKIADEGLETDLYGESEELTRLADEMDGLFEELKELVADTDMDVKEYYEKLDLLKDKASEILDNEAVKTAEAKFDYLNLKGLVKDAFFMEIADGLRSFAAECESYQFEPMQYFLTKLDLKDCEILDAYGVKYAYFEPLDLDIIFVEHWGTLWDGVGVTRYTKYFK